MWSLSMRHARRIVDEPEGRAKKRTERRGAFDGQAAQARQKHRNRCCAGRECEAGRHGIERQPRIGKAGQPERGNIA